MHVPNAADAANALTVISDTASGRLALGPDQMRACAEVLSAFQQGRPVADSKLSVVNNLKGRLLWDPCS